MDQKNYFIGIDAGTNSVGWAVSDPEYNVIKKAGKALWGSRLFEVASTAEKRRVSRSVRRRGDRQTFRQSLLRELFATEITRADPAFYLRLDESKFWEEDKKVPSRYALFNDPEFNDRDYHAAYPTIYHLRRELMSSREPHDVRLVYLAAAHLIKHRGHFFMQMSVADSRPDFLLNWSTFTEHALDLMGLNIACEDLEALQNVLKEKMPVREKQKKLKSLIVVSGAPEASDFTCIYDLLSGKSVDVSKSFGIRLAGEEKNALRLSFTGEDLDDEEKIMIFHSYLEDNFQILLDLKDIYDWGVLVGILHGAATISEGKVASYEKHEQDLKKLQKLVKAEFREQYNECFRYVRKGLNNYCAYSGHFDRKNERYKKESFRCSRDDFYAYLKKLLKPSQSTAAKEILQEMELGSFLPLQHDKENSVIPYQMNLHELQVILDNASTYLPFLNERDAEGISVRSKVESLLTFRIPYYVGPLDNTNAKPGTHWAVKREPQTQVLPWNFERVVDKEASAKAFMGQLTNTCTYLLGETVLPKDSVFYSHFMALNELNNVTIYGQKLPVAVKQKAFIELFTKKPLVRRKNLEVFLRAEGLLQKGEEDAIGGIDGDFKASLKTEQKLRGLLAEQAPTDQLLDEVILSVLLLKQEPDMLRNRIRRLVPHISESQLKQVCSLPCTGWGHLSRKFLVNLRAVLPELGDQPVSILDALWRTQYNLMQLLSNSMPYKGLLDKCNAELFEDVKLNYQAVEKLSAPPAVRRTIWQTLKIVEEITHIMGGAPAKIFVEMAKGPSGTGRTVSRKCQLMSCYQSIKEDGHLWVQKLDAYDDPKLRQDKLYLYFTQLGRCMYTGEAINLQALLNDGGNQIFDIDHIYPRSKVKDDSLDNRVLVYKKANQEKTDRYPLAPEIRKAQSGFWKFLYEHNLISKIKLERLIRSTRFTEEELAGFISRQLVETRQGTKLLAHLLEQALPESRIVYVKAGNVSDFRQCFDLVKVRDLNDLHHAKDAYLNIVVGNVYDVKFTADPLRFLHSSEPYSMKTEVLFNRTVKRGNQTAWQKDSIETVKRNYRKNNILVTRMALRRNSGKNGGFYDQNAVRGGPIPLKGDSRMADTQRYGGYNGDTGAYMFLVEHGGVKKRTRSLEPMYLRYVKQAEEGPFGLEDYCRNVLGLKDPKIIIPEILFNTLMEVKGFRFWLTGRSGTAQIVGIQSFQMVLAPKSENYIKKVLRVCERLKSAKDNIEITEAHDRVSSQHNLELYDILLEKMQLPVYRSRPSSQVKTLTEGRDTFKQLGLAEQCKMLSAILNLFRGNGKTDITGVGGSKAAGMIQFSKNTGDDFRVFYTSATGFYSHEDRRLEK